MTSLDQRRSELAQQATQTDDLTQQLMLATLAALIHHVERLDERLTKLQDQLAPM